MKPLRRFRPLVCAAALTILTLTSGLAGPAQAAEGRWESVGPFGGHISALAVAPSDRRIVYAGTAEGLIFRSAEAGTSWTSVTGDFPDAGVSDLVVDPGDPSTAYAAVCLVIVELVTYKQGGVFKTTDGGQTWELVTEQGSECHIYDLAIDPRQPSRILAATTSGLRRSDDGGASWRTSPGLAGKDAVTGVGFGAAPGTLFAVHYKHGVLKSVDDGASWTPKNTGLPAERWRIFGLATAPVPSGAGPETLYVGAVEAAAPVFRSLDGGETWSPAAAGLGRRRVYDLAVDPTVRGVYAATDDGVFRSVDGGQSWIAPPPGRGRRPSRTVAVPALPAGTAYAGHLAEGISRTADGGASWRAANRGLTGVPVNHLVIAPSDGSVRYAFKPDLKILRSLDGGATWLPNGRVPDGLPLNIAIHPRNPRVAYAGGFHGGIWKTTNAGASWRRVNGEETACMDVGNLEIDPRTPSNIYAAGLFGSCPQYPDICLGFKSTDAGESWSCMEGLTAQGVVSLVLAPSLPTTLYAGTDVSFPQKPVFKSTDAGRTWRPRSGGLPQRGFFGVAVSPLDPRTVFAVSQAGLFKSVDGAARWAPSGQGLPAGHNLGGLAISPFNPSQLFIVATRFDSATGEVFSDLYRSVDAGASWTPLSKQGLPEGSLRSLVLSPTEPGTLYVTTRFGIFKLTLPV